MDELQEESNLDKKNKHSFFAHVHSSLIWKCSFTGQLFEKMYCLTKQIATTNHAEANDIGLILFMNTTYLGTSITVFLKYSFDTTFIPLQSTNEFEGNCLYW